MVRNRSWPAVSHWMVLVERRESEHEMVTYNLQLDRFTVQLNRPDFLYCISLVDPVPSGVTYKVNADGRDIALGICIVGES
jgi:hypothetical protein